MGRRKSRCRRYLGCDNHWLWITAALLAVLLLALAYPAGLLMFLLGAVLACIVFVILHK